MRRERVQEELSTSSFVVKRVAFIESRVQKPAVYRDRALEEVYKGKPLSEEDKQIISALVNQQVRIDEYCSETGRDATSAKSTLQDILIAFPKRLSEVYEEVIEKMDRAQEGDVQKAVRDFSRMYR